jgi:uncharacterized phage protein (TIGR01671 family)
MNKSTNEAGQLGTTDQQITTADNQQVSQPNANTNVVGSLFKSRLVEFKFRDFDLETKEMRYFTMDEYDRNEHDCYGNMMAFTGLKDKMGKEIYIGDIIKKHVHNNYKCSRGVVYKENVYRNYLVEPTEYLGYKFRPLIPEPKYFELGSNEFVCIGNIFETPELLEAVR